MVSGEAVVPKGSKNITMFLKSAVVEPVKELKVNSSQPLATVVVTLVTSWNNPPFPILSIFNHTGKPTLGEYTFKVKEVVALNATG